MLFRGGHPGRGEDNRGGEASHLGGQEEGSSQEEETQELGGQECQHRHRGGCRGPG